MQFIDLHRQYDVIEEKINKRLKEFLKINTSLVAKMFRSLKKI